MNLTEEMQRALVDNAQRICHEHKEHCDDPDCWVSLHWVRMLVEQAGLEHLIDDEAAFC